MVRTSTLILFLLLAPGAAHAHGGGLDALGCHTNAALKVYECHKGTLAGRSFASKADALAALNPPTPVPAPAPHPVPVPTPAPTPHPVPVPVPVPTPVPAPAPCPVCPVCTAPTVCPVPAPVPAPVPTPVPVPAPPGDRGAALAACWSATVNQYGVVATGPPVGPISISISITRPAVPEATFTVTYDALAFLGTCMSARGFGGQ